MKLKLLANVNYLVAAVIEGDECPVEKFLFEGESSTTASRDGLLIMLKHAATVGLDDLPSAWVHEACKKEKIFEFVKGRLRILFFKGKDGCIAVCCGTDFKKTNKANPAQVARAVRLRNEYFKAIKDHTLIMERDHGTK